MRERSEFGGKLWDMLLLRRKQRKKERVGQVGFLIVKLYAYPFLIHYYPV
jgi:hypothetical protein